MLKLLPVFLALLGTVCSKRQVVLSPPPVVPSPPPPSPPGAAPTPAPVTFPTPGFLWGVVIPGYVQSTFGTTQASQLCAAIVDKDFQPIASEECVVSEISTYNGTNVLVKGYTFWGWKEIPNAAQLSVANALRDYAVKQLIGNSSSVLGSAFPGSYTDCACDGMNQVTRSGGLPFEYKNITGLPASVAGPPQCGARLSYDSANPNAVFNQVGVDSAPGANFGKLCAPGGVEGGVVGTPGSGTCVQYGVLSSTPGTATQATASGLPTGTTGQIDTAIRLVSRGSGYVDRPVVTISPPTPTAVTSPSFTIDGNLKLSGVSFSANNGPYSVRPSASFNPGSPVCVSNAATPGANVRCTGPPSTFQDASGTIISGPSCTEDLTAVLTGSRITGFGLPDLRGGAAPIQIGGVSPATNVFCAGTPTATVSTIGLQLGTQATAIASIDTTPSSPTFGQVTAVTVTNAGSGYVQGLTPTITIAPPSTGDVGKLCSPAPITGLSPSIAYGSAIPITTTGACRPIGYDTRSKKACSVPAVAGGITEWNALGVQTCSTVSSYRVQPDSPSTSSCLVLAQEFVASVIPAVPPATPPASPPAVPPASPPAVPPASPPTASPPTASPPATPPSPTPLVCRYSGVFELRPLYSPCSSYYIASGTDNDCSNNLVNLRLYSQLGGKPARKNWRLDTVAQNNLSTPTRVEAIARARCGTSRYLAAPNLQASGGLLRVGGNAWEWQVVPYPGSKSCEEVNLISQNNLDSRAFLEVPRTCTRFLYNATDGGRQRFRVRSV